jgi:hypothetical protein
LWSDEHGWHDDVDHELRGNATRCRGHSSGGQAAVIRRIGKIGASPSVPTVPTLLDKRYGPGMRTAAASAVAIALTTNEDELALQTQLYYLMVCLLSGPVLRELKTVATGNGLEAWRKLSHKYEPKTRKRQLALLDSCLRPQLDGVGDKFIEQLTAWEQDIEKYDCGASTAFADDLKIATLMRAVSDQTRSYLVQIMTRSALSVMDYDDIRESLQRYVSAQKSWTVVDPMDVGAFG